MGGCVGRLRSIKFQHVSLGPFEARERFQPLRQVEAETSGTMTTKQVDRILAMMEDPKVTPPQNRQARRAERAEARRFARKVERRMRAVGRRRRYHGGAA